MDGAVVLRDAIARGGATGWVVAEEPSAEDWPPARQTGQTSAAGGVFCAGRWSPHSPCAMAVAAS